MLSPTIVAIGLSCAFAAAAIASPREEDRPSDREAIRRHIEEIFRAYREEDRETIRKTHAANWRGFVRLSRGVVQGIDQYMAEAEQILQGPWRLISHRMAAFDVVFQDDVALVSYVADLELEREGEGVRVPDKLRVLDVYAKENGAWNQIASNVCTHPDSLEAQRQRPRTLPSAERAELLKARESVWRAWYGNDRAALERLIPEDALAINPAGEEWPRRAEILAGAGRFAAAGGRLVRLEFPRTEIQAWGDVAVLYTTWIAEVEEGGARRVDSGRGTEMFVRRAGAWVNPGWHLDSGGQAPR